MMLQFFNRVFDNLLYRKLYHLFGGGIFVLGLAILDKNWFILIDSIYILFFKLVGKRISFAAIGILLLYLVSGSRSVTLYAVVIWLVGDGMAALIGSAYGARKWPWSTHKTILGSGVFFASSILAALPLAFLSFSAPSRIINLLVILPCVFASVVEMLPFTFVRDRKADDNLLVILSTGLLVNALVVLLDVYVKN